MFNGNFGVQVAMSAVHHCSSSKIHLPHNHLQHISPHPKSQTTLSMLFYQFIPDDALRFNLKALLIAFTVSQNNKRYCGYYPAEAPCARLLPHVRGASMTMAS